MTDINQVTKPHLIGLEFYSKQANKSHLIVNNDGSKAPIIARNGWYDYNFAEPVYLTSLEVVTSGYEDWNKIHIKVDHFDGTVHDQEVALISGKAALKLGKLANGFSFKPEKRFLTETQIQNVVCRGLSLSEFHAYEDAIKSFEERSSALLEKEATLSQLNAKVVELNSEVAGLTNNAGKLRAEVNQLGENKSQAQSQLDSLEQKIDQVKSRTLNATEELNEKIYEIEEAESRLLELTRELRVFPSEITGFVREGNRNIFWYVLLGAPFLTVLIIILNSLFNSAVDLTQLWRETDSIDVWTIFLTRLPFVFIAFALIEACGYILGRFVFEVVRINRERLEFSKLSIIAKDVSVAAALSTDIEEENRYNEEVKLRMALLREHMKSVNETEFVYKGSSLVSALISVAEKLSGAGKS